MSADDEKIRKSLKYSILDGAFSASMIGFGESFFTAYAVMPFRRKGFDDKI